jgi:hypothetical protein
VLARDDCVLRHVLGALSWVFVQINLLALLNSLLLLLGAEGLSIFEERGQESLGLFGLLLFLLLIVLLFFKVASSSLLVARHHLGLDLLDVSG